MFLKKIRRSLLFILCDMLLPFYFKIQVYFDHEAR